MEKKTKFKLKFVKSHLQKPRIHKTKPIQRPHSKVPDPVSPPSSSLQLLKYFDPIKHHRVIGDLVFIDQISCDSDDLVGLSSMWSPFKTIKDIKVSQNFILCNYEDNYQFTQVGLLTDRLKSLGNRECYDLASTIEQYINFFKQLPFTNRSPPESRSCQAEFTQCLKQHEAEPMIFYHYRTDKAVRTKIGANKLLKNMSFQDDIQLFEDSLFVVSARDYFPYMRNHLQSCFSPETKTVTMHMRTVLGVKTVQVVCQSFLLGEERVIVLTFPKELQSLEIQQLFDSLSRGSVKPRNVEVKESSCKYFVYKNLETWENLMKQYFEPWMGFSGFPNDGGMSMKQEDNNCYLKMMGHMEVE